MNPSLAKLLGIEIDFERVTAVVVDAAGGLLGRGARPCNARQGVEAILAPCDAAIGDALQDAGVSPRAIRYLGIGHPGAFDPETQQCVLWAGAPSWTGVALRSIFEQRYPWRIALDDRSRVYALAERRSSPSDGRHPFVLYVIAGTGVGAGIFANGRLYRGASAAGSEIGHTVVDPGGPACRCGSRGCVETYASAGAILKADELLSREASPAGTKPASRMRTVEEVAEASRRGDRAASASLERAAWALGHGIANAVQLLNPSLIVLAGRVARAGGQELLERVQQIVRERCVPNLVRPVSFRLAPARKDPAAIGAALLAAEEAIQEALWERLFGIKKTARCK